jgi:hypothetical protein
MGRLIEAAIGHEADRHLSGTVEVDEIYVSCGHKAEPESAPWSSCWFSAAGRG